MTRIPYFKMMRESKDPKYLRCEFVHYAKQHAVKPAARAFGTTAKTVRKRRKHRTEQDLRAIKAQWRLFEQSR
ncbi:MAG: hypothetical protein ONB46_21105 [candidate division KSB1 bacterium]|nr:hypothetical protein [candidate division KSB1 bacterium]MDZ7368457.1 hypothetical protein [candidate division KSB1 bacterium]MDZ7406183.1 hypothetical protein [candidate division KSB1 bacterium]